MKKTIRQWMFLGLVTASSGLNAIAGESVVYQFDGWKVTITPGRSATTPARPLPALQSVPSRVDTPTDAATSRRRSQVRPISFQQNQPESNESKPEEANASVETTPAPAPAPGDTAFPLPPSPPSEQPVAAAAASDCCDLPVITPRSPDAAPLPNPAVIPLQTALYRDIYFSIPFNRAEYNAYPSYRHDATMELLFNQMRNTIIQRGTTNVYQYDMNQGSIYTPYYPYNYGLRIHSSR